jgi:predicted nucleic acid-binding protein
MKASFVMDASATIAGLSPDEANAAYQQLVERVIAEDVAVAVPTLWCYEVANILTLKLRKNKISAAAHDDAMQCVRDFQLSIDPMSPEMATFGTAVVLARRHGLTVYDASYLELALRLNVPLASLDGDLVQAARQNRVAIWGE